MRSIRGAMAPPAPFVLAARALPLGLLAQFLTAGQALFRDDGLWGVHGALGVTLAVPVAGLLGGALLVRRLRGFAASACLIAALYVAQLALGAADHALPLSLHPLNGAILLAASLVLLARAERGRDEMAAAPAGAQP